MISIISLSKSDINVGKIGRHFYIKTKNGSLIYLTKAAALEMAEDILALKDKEDDIELDLGKF